MNAPERITSLLIAPGVLLLNPDVEVDVAARKRAVGAIMRQLERAKISPSGMSGRDLLAALRSRHDRAALRP